MTERAKNQAETVAAMPHVRAWLRRMRKVAKDMPAEVWIYVASGTPAVMACDMENGRKMFENDGRNGAPRDGADQDAIIEHLNGGSWDGGDW